ncbi:MAG: TOPRIM nucleotidyl transferase/hydrolase domain-containing protein [Acidimicrobiales bacterium]
MPEYASGPDAPLHAEAAALASAESARTVVLVEGISDQVAVETLAARDGRNLAADGVVVVPIGGAHAIGRHLSRFGPRGADLHIAGMCDAGEEKYFRRGLAEAGVGTPGSRVDMERLGFFVCVDDLEDELIRASGQELIEAVLEREGDLVPFRTLQKQPQWRRESFDAQMHRFLGAGARRKTRYAQLLVDALGADRMPHPLAGLATWI